MRDLFGFVRQNVFLEIDLQRIASMFGILLGAFVFGTQTIHLEGNAVDGNLFPFTDIKSSQKKA